MCQGFYVHTCLKIYNSPITSILQGRKRRLQPRWDSTISLTLEPLPVNSNMFHKNGKGVILSVTLGCTIPLKIIYQS